MSATVYSPSAPLPAQIVGHEFGAVQVMQQTLWAITRSPLIYGGKAEAIVSSNPHVAIMTNPRVLAVSDHSTQNKQAPMWML